MTKYKIIINMNRNGRSGNSGKVVLFAILLVLFVTYTKPGKDLYITLTSKTVGIGTGIFSSEVFLIIFVLIFAMMIISMYNLDMSPDSLRHADTANQLKISTTIEGFDKIGNQTFCDKYSSNPNNLNTECGKFGEGTCNTTKCCVWLNGEKCVAGDKNGPTFMSDDDGKQIEVKKYMFRKKCYGDCRGDASPLTPQ